jgi:hypothetical protein
VSVKRPVFIAVLVCMAFASSADARGVSQATFSLVVGRAAQIGIVGSVEAEQSNAAAAAIAISPHTVWQPESLSAVPVTLFVLHGSFDDVIGPGPPGAVAPKGHVLAYIVNQSEEIAAMSLGNEAIHLSGPVQRFRSSQDRAIIARADHELPRAPRARRTCLRETKRPMGSLQG